MKKRTGISLLIGSLVFGTTAAANANDQEDISERQRLENVMVEITYLQQYLRETKQSVKHNIRTRFDYGRINAELNTIKSGIGEYVDQKRAQPKQTAAAESVISGSYQQ